MRIQKVFLNLMWGKMHLFFIQPQGWMEKTSNFIKQVNSS